MFAKRETSGRFCCILYIKGWRSGESARLPPMWPGFKSRRRSHMWVEFVVGSLLCSERFSPGTPVFPSPQKPTLPNSNSTRNQVDEEPLCGCVTSKPLFHLIYLFITIIHVYSLVFLSYMLQPIRIRLKTLSCFETNLYVRVFLRTHANKPVSDPQTKIICKETLLITVFVLYKLRNTCKLRLTGDLNTQYRIGQRFCLKCQLNAYFDK